MRSKEGVARFLQTNYALYLRRFIEMYGSKRSVNSFTPDDIRGWVGRLLKSGYSPKTVNHHLRTLSMVFNRSIAEGWASKNPCLAVASIKTERDEVSVLPLADARKLFEASRGHRVAYTWHSRPSAVFASRARCESPQATSISRTSPSSCRRPSIRRADAMCSRAYPRTYGSGSATPI